MSTFAKLPSAADALADATPGARSLAAQVPMFALTGAPGDAGARAGGAPPAAVLWPDGLGPTTAALRAFLGPDGFRLLCMAAVAGEPTGPRLQWLAGRFEVDAQ